MKDRIIHSFYFFLLVLIELFQKLFLPILIFWLYGFVSVFVFWIDGTPDYNTMRWIILADYIVLLLAEGHTALIPIDADRNLVVKLTWIGISGLALGCLFFFTEIDIFWVHLCGMFTCTVSVLSMLAENSWTRIGEKARGFFNEE